MIYANDNDANACRWMAELPLRVDRIDSRSIADVQPQDLEGFTQCHFFAGILGWPLALQIAGFPESAEAWTGSCPCQPFSAAGKREGINDERHVWPEFRRLIAARRPPIIFGEQVASSDGREWFGGKFPEPATLFECRVDEEIDPGASFAGIRSELEQLGYAVGAADLPACSVGAPHIRQRLFWGAVLPGWRPEWLGDSDSQGCRERRERSERDSEPEAGRQSQRRADAGGSGDISRLGESYNGRKTPLCEVPGRSTVERMGGIRRSTQGHWSTADYLYCRDNKWRPVEPGTFPLVDGVSAVLADGTEISREEMSRAQALRGIGNAIVPQLAAEFVMSFLKIQNTPDSASNGKQSSNTMSGFCPAQIHIA